MLNSNIMYCLIDDECKCDTNKANSNVFTVSDLLSSNVGGESITQIALDFWKAGRDREEIELNDLEKVLSLSAFNSNNSE